MAANENRFVQCISTGEKLRVHLAADHANAASFVLVVPVAVSASGHVDASHVGEGRKRTGHEECPGVMNASDGNAALAELRKSPLDVGRLLHDHAVIVGAPLRPATGTCAAGLHASPAREDDHDVLPERFGDLRLADAQSLAGGDHERDRHDAPRNAEHGQRRAQLVRPERPNCVEEEILEDHGGPLLLQDDLLAFLESLDHLGFHAVRQAELDGNLALAALDRGVGYLD